MNDSVKIQITEEEWFALSEEKRERIKDILENDYGYNIDSLINLGDGNDPICPYCKGEGCGVCKIEEDEE